MNYVQEYISKIESGEINTNWKIKKWYCNHIKPILEGKSDKYYFDEAKGERIITYIETFCKQRKGIFADQPLKLMLFQKAKWQAIMGILCKDTGYRRFREVFDVRGRKNGKSTELAAVALYLVREELGAEVYVSASTLKQAKLLWDEAKSMVKRNPDLSANRSPKRGRIGHGVYNWRTFPQSDIYIDERDAHLIALAANLEALDGLNASAAIIDEVHVLQRDIYDLLKQSQTSKSRKQPLLHMISTAGFLRGGLYDDIYDYAINILNGIVEDDSFFPLIYDLDDEKQIKDEKNWVLANPGIDCIKDRFELRTLVKRMSADSNISNTVKIKDFNLRGVENKVWLPFEVFNNEEVYTKEQLSSLRKYVIGGFDLSRTTDMTAFTTLYFDEAKGKIIAETMYWITQSFYESELDKNSKVPWRAWLDRGLLRISGQYAINYHDIAEWVSEKFNYEELMYQFICYDSYSATYLVDELAAQGYQKGYCLNPVIQGFKSLSIPMQTLENDLREKRLVYQNNPITKWCFSNVELVQDRNGNLMPKKCDDSTKRKIDGVATILNCYYALVNNREIFV